jgi:hypothetical protein
MKAKSISVAAASLLCGFMGVEAEATTYSLTTNMFVEIDTCALNGGPLGQSFCHGGAFSA